MYVKVLDDRYGLVDVCTLLRLAARQCITVSGLVLCILMKLLMVFVVNCCNVWSLVSDSLCQTKGTRRLWYKKETTFFFLGNKVRY